MDSLRYNPSETKYCVFICFTGTKRADLTFKGFMVVDAVPANGCRALTSLDRAIGVVNAGLFSPAYAVVGMGKA